jgi:hypothetical protein
LASLFRVFQQTVLGRGQSEQPPEPEGERMTSVDLKPAQQTRAAGRFASPLTQKIFLGLVLAVAVVAVYYPVHRQPFANYDDADYVTDNFTRLESQSDRRLHGNLRRLMGVSS